MVATGQAPTGQVQLAEHAHRHRLQVAIEDVAGQVGDRPADRHRVLALLHAGPVGDVDGRLGRAIEVIEAGLRQLGEHLLLRVRRQRLAAANDAFQAGAGGDVFILQEGLQHRRHEVQRIDPFAVDQLHQLRRVAMVARRGHHQTRPAHQRPEELPDRHVEAERGFLQHRVTDAQAIGLLHPAQTVAQRRMAVAGALGLTGGTGGVDDIGEVLAIEMNIRVRLTVILEPGRTAIQVDPLHALRQRQLQVRLAEQQLHAAVLQHVGLALLGILRVHRNVGAAGLEDCHQGHDHLDGTFHGHAHQAVRADPALDQGMRQAVGPAVQLGVVQALLAEGQRRRRRRALDLLLEQPVHAALQRVLGRSGVPAFQQLVALLGIEHRQRVDAGLRVLQHAAQQVLPMPRHALDGPRLEQVGRVGQRGVQAAALLVGIQAQVELGGTALPVELAEAQAGHAVQRLDVGHQRLVVVHHLEQRAMAQAALDLERLDQALERQILMGLGAKHGVLEPGQQGRHRRAAVEYRAQHLGVDEQADQPFHLGAVAVGNGDADPQVGLPAIALQEDIEAAEQQHEQGQPLASGGAAQGLGQGRLDAELVTAATVAGNRRTRVVGRQLQDRMPLAELAAPVLQLALLLTGLQPAALPQGVIGVLDRQGRQAGLRASRIGTVETTEFFDQHVHRPAVGHDVMQGQQQHMPLLAQADQADPQQRPLAQVERLQRLALRLLAQAGFLLGLGQAAAILEGNLQRALQGRLRQAVVGAAREHRTQGFMTLHQAGEGALQRLAIQRSVQAHRAGQVVGATLWLQVPEEPHALLGVGQAVALGRRHAGRNREQREIDSLPSQGFEEDPTLLNG
ncbi:putative non-ribosomal peptide synthetase [Pseudomonas aeruginosa 39016]|nr:putative non-ribosomal peptide synthetase [Pseudomonas aeruginosa 39016]